MVIELSVAKLIADSQDTDFCRTISNVFKDAPMKRVTLLSTASLLSYKRTI